MNSKADMFFIFLAGTLFITIFVSALILFLIQYKKKQVKFYTEKLEIQHKYDTQLLQTKLEVQEQSFKRFSEEIHDNSGQLLSSVKHQLFNIMDEVEDAQTINRMTEAADLLGRAIGDLRNISHTLNNSFIAKAGVVEAVEKELRYINSSKGLNARLHITGEEYNLGNERELLVFRIIQEAIANALKHAKPSAINIYIGYAPSLFTVDVKDNGVGFQAKEKKTDGGIGLDNMHARAGMLKGRLSIATSNENGTNIHLEIDNLNQAVL